MAEQDPLATPLVTPLAAPLAEPLTLRERIYDEIDEEREYQLVKHGTARDDTHTLVEWIGYVTHQVGKCYTGVYGQYLSVFRKHMVRTAALAVAAIEAIDRKKGQSE